MNLKVDVERKDGIAVVKVEGEIDLYTSSHFRNELHKLIDEGYNKLIISLDNVGYIDSTGLGILIGTLKRLKEVGGKLTVVCSSPQIKKVFTITGLVKILGLHENLQQAIDYIASEKGGE